MLLRLLSIAISLAFLLAGYPGALPSAREAGMQKAAETVIASAEYPGPNPSFEPEEMQEKRMTPPPDAEYTPNPYAGFSERSDYWKYDVFEIFRGAETVLFDDTLTHTQKYHWLINDDWYTDFPHDFTCDITLPQSTGSKPWAEAINLYYQENLPNCIAEGDAIWRESLDDWHVTHYGYYYEAAYQLENVLNVVRSRRFVGWRPSIGWEPFVDLFSALDGQRLCLDDLFRADREAYLPVLQAALSNAAIFNSEDPETGEEIRPMNQDTILDSIEQVSVAVSPAGLVLIYPTGWADCMAAGVVFLCVPYDVIQDMLNPVYFPILSGS